MTAAAHPVEGPMRIYRARRIITLAGGEPEAFCVSSGTIVAVGNAAELESRYGAEVIDLGDATIVPGFYDAHLHLGFAAREDSNVDASWPGTASVDDLLDRLRRRAQDLPASSWVHATGHDDTRTGPLTRRDLDGAVPGHPVIVDHVAGHWAIFNSRALQLAEIDESTRAPDAGRYGRDASGRLDGILYGRAATDLPAERDGRVVLPDLGTDELLAGLASAQERFHAVGLTSVGDALTDATDLALFREADRRGQLTLRVDVLVHYEHYALVRGEAVGAELGSGRVRLSGVKAFIDAAIGGRNCLLEEPFEGTDDTGVQTMPTEELNALVLQMQADGMRLGVHANGDRAIRLLLDAYEAAARAYPSQSLRHRIEHCTVIDEDILERMHALGTIAVPLSTYVHFYGSKLIDWYGASRVKRMFAHRSFLDAGVEVIGSSDYPCGPLGPLLAMQSCVTRLGYDGALIGAEQRISPLEALELFTTAPARVAGVSDVRGRLAPGCVADFVVLAEDPLAGDPARIGSIPVLGTYVAGRQVWPVRPAVANS